MKNEIKVEKVKGNYAIVIALITVFGGVLIYFLNQNSNSALPKKSNQIVVEDNKNSPVANEIGTQNNYYGELPSKTTNSEFKKDSNSHIDISKSKSPQRLFSKDKDPISKAKTQMEQNPIINAPNALIATNGQSGGSNTVIQQIPNPSVSLPECEVYNQIVKEINFEYGEVKTILLPSEGFNYDSLYKTKFTFNYSCPVALNEIGFKINRKDVVLHDMSHLGRMQKKVAKNSKQPIYVLTNPENGLYTFTVYTVNKFENLQEAFEVLKN